MIALLAVLLAAPPADFLREEQTPLLHFRYGWPAAAGQMPGLRARLRREMAAARSWALARAAEGRQAARRSGFDYAGQVIAPADTDGNGRFETLRVLLPPYLAGPYVEGDYVIDLPFDPEDLAPVPGRYRPAFEVPGAR